MPLELDTLETSFVLVAPHGEALEDVFYARLFAVAPAVEPMFAATDLPRRRRDLASRLGTGGRRANRPRRGCDVYRAATER